MCVLELQQRRYKDNNGDDAAPAGHILIQSGRTKQPEAQLTSAATMTATMTAAALLAVAAAAAAAATIARPALISAYQQSSFVPGARWLDVHGDLIRAHAGHLLLIGGMYHWYGMEYIGAGSPPGAPHTVNVYVSPDL
eukprot:COSAG01_NODE_3093_length_6594_cov_368.508237_1_plen_137_part_10